MPAVFVHGVPDTHRVWRPLLERLRREDVVTLSLPGFGCPEPPGWTATKEAYVDWLLDELRRLPRPIDLVGHDWGSELVVRAVSLEPSLVRTWAGGGAPVDPEYRWHWAARTWQTPILGELFMLATTRPGMRLALRGVAVPAAAAAEATAHFDHRMKRCILRLYRSAVHLGREWAADLARVESPGIVFWGERDPYAAASFGENLARNTRARFHPFDGCGHWWQLQRVAEVAAALEALWAAA